MNILRSNSLVNIRHKEIVKIIPIFVQVSQHQHQNETKKTFYFIYFSEC